jgi:Family of unknown function (DUF5996)
MADHSLWPDLPLPAWIDTCETVYRWTQIVGKTALALTPLVNHWWNVVLFVTPRGLATAPLYDRGRSFDIEFDFLEHRLVLRSSDGGFETIALRPLSVAEFYAEYMLRLKKLDVSVHIWTMPSEIENATPFEQDRQHAEYDPLYVERFWRALLQADRILRIFRSRFLGKCSPVHFFWGSFDLAVTRFSGRTAPPPKSKTPNVAPRVMTEAYSHEVSSCGFWPGNGGYGRAAFYVYAYPEPRGYGGVRLSTPSAFYDEGLGQFILPYDAVREAPDPDPLLLGFLQETYAAAADLGGWDRETLERQSSAT